MAYHSLWSPPTFLFTPELKLLAVTLKIIETNFNWTTYLSVEGSTVQSLPSRGQTTGFIYV